MPLWARICFTEIFEVAQTELVREASSNVQPKYMGAVNQVYLNEMPEQLPETYIRKLGYITLAAAYSTGTVTVSSGGTSITGATTSWTTAYNDMYINVSGYNRLYRVTDTTPTNLTLNNSLTWVGASGSGLSYTLIQDRYALPSDFSYMAEDNPEYPNIVSYYVNGFQIFLFPSNNEDYDRTIVPTTSTAFSKYTVKWDNSTPYLHVWPFPLNIDIVNFFYIPKLTAMVEYTTGTCTFTTGTAVTGSGTNWASLNTAFTYFMRNDADGTGSASVWTQVSSIGNATTMSLSSGFAGTSGAGITYTISQVSQWPERFDSAMLYKTCLIVDPDNVQTPKWTQLYTEAMGIDKSVEAKRKRASQVKSWFGLRNN